MVCFLQGEVVFYFLETLYQLPHKFLLKDGGNLCAGSDETFLVEIQLSIINLMNTVTPKDNNLFYIDSTIEKSIERRCCNVEVYIKWTTCARQVNQQESGLPFGCRCGATACMRREVVVAYSYRTTHYNHHDENKAPSTCHPSGTTGIVRPLECCHCLSR